MSKLAIQAQYGRNVKDRMVQHGLTQIDLAKYIGLKESCVSRRLSGATKISFEERKAIEDFLTLHGCGIDPQASDILTKEQAPDAPGEIREPYTIVVTIQYHPTARPKLESSVVSV